MNQFLTADQARDLTFMSSYKEKLEVILAKVEREAEQGNRTLKIKDYGFSKKYLPQERRPQAELSIISVLRDLDYTVGIMEDDSETEAYLMIQW